MTPQAIMLGLGAFGWSKLQDIRRAYERRQDEATP
jgi:hypothetical protein